MRALLKPTLVLVLLVPVTACSDDAGRGAAASPEAATSASPPASPPASPTSSATASPQPSAGAPVDEPTSPVVFRADTRPDTGAARGGQLTVVEVRAGVQQGYDRVVFEFDGAADGEPGWRVAYADQARQQGSGDVVEVGGQKVLQVLLTGVGYPFDTGVEEQNDDPDLPPGLTVVRDVVLDGTFEGQYQAFVGTSGQLPFRVFRLADPARVVIDVRHS